MKSPLHFFQGVKYHFTGDLFLPKPVYFGLGVTNRCDARCIMCPIWRTKNGGEPSVEEIGQIFSHPLLNKIRTVGISGGEPTLREDLPEIVNKILEVNQSVKWMSVITNGLNPELFEKELKRIITLPALQNLDTFAVQVSLDGYGEVHDKIRGIPYAFERTAQTLYMLRNLQSLFPFRIQILTVVQKLNVENLPELSRFGRKLNIPIRFTPVRKKPENASFFYEKLMPSSLQLRKIREYFKDDLKDDLDLLAISFWKDYFRIIEGKERKVPCALPYYSLSMSGEGNLFICGVADDRIYGNIHDNPIDTIWYSQDARRLREEFRQQICPECWAWCVTNLSLSLEFFYFAKFFLKSFFSEIAIAP